MKLSTARLWIFTPSWLTALSSTVAEARADVRFPSAIAWCTVGRYVATRSPMVAGVLATGGGLVFTGDAEGFFTAYDADTGKVLWNFQCGSGHHASPITYTLEGPFDDLKSDVNMMSALTPGALRELFTSTPANNPGLLPAPGEQRAP